MTGKEYRTITDVKGPLVFLNKTEPVAFGEIVELRLTDGIGRIRDGAGRPREGGPDIVADEKADIIGAAINPYSRQSP